MLLAPAALILVLLSADLTVAHAACDVIPGIQQGFASAQGIVDRPFAGPGDWVRISRDRACQGDGGGFFPEASGNVVTLMFRPSVGPRHAVILATDCSFIEPFRQACGARRDIASATCIPINDPQQGASVVVSDRNQLEFAFPDTDGIFRTCAGANAGSACVHDADCPAGTCSDGTDDDVTFAGPVAIAVSEAGLDLPCDLASRPCADERGTLACVDSLFVPQSNQCSNVPNDVFASFTALPPRNDYQALCSTADTSCTGLQGAVRFALDAAGDVLMPMDWSGILVRPDGVPVPRIISGSTAVPAFASGTQPQPIRIPESDPPFIGSFSTDGRRLPPIFDAQIDPKAGSDVAALFGSADAPHTVLRIARRSPGALLCRGGANDGLRCVTADTCPQGTCGISICDGGSVAGSPCVSDSDCSGGGLCRTGLFDFGSRIFGKAGPVVIRTFGAQVSDPVALDSVTQTPLVSAFVVNEALANPDAQSSDERGKDLDGDGDKVDDVIQLSDRVRGGTQTLPPTQGCSIAGAATGRAVARLHQAPFSSPAVAAAGGVVAFLESEVGEKNCDENHNGRVFDAILRVFPLGGNEATPEMPSGLTADAAPAIDGQPLVVSGPRVFFRSDPAMESIVREGVPPGGGISSDGRFVLLQTGANNDSACTLALFDRRNGSTQPLGGCSSAATACDALRAAADDGGNFVDLGGALSRDRRFLVFESSDPLAPADTNNLDDVYVRDCLTGELDRADLSTSGLQGGDVHPQLSAGRVISEDGRYVTFRSRAVTLVPGDLNESDDVFVRDRVAGTTELVSVSSDGEQGDSASMDASISADGRYVVFASFAANLVPGDTNNQLDVFVHDRVRGTTELMSDGTSGRADGPSFSPAISADGRYVAFVSTATNLVDGAGDGSASVYVRDRLTKVTERAIVGGNIGALDAIYVSGDGLTVLAGDTVRGRDVTLAGPQTSVLRVFDTSGAMSDIGPVTQASVHDERAAFLRPENTDDATQIGGVDLNGDGDADDDVVELWTAPTGAVDLGCAATDVSLGDQLLGALVSERDQGVDLNGDGDLDDTVAFVHTATDAVNATCGDGSWVNTGQAADMIATSGSVVAFITPEAAQGVDLNHDGDLNDRVLQVYLADTGEVINKGQAAEEFVIGGRPGRELIAFRTSEAAQHADLNGDGDEADDVLQVFDVESKQVVSTDDPVTTCQFEACDPRVPYKVGQDSVSFLTFECDAGGPVHDAGCPGGGTDLNGNGTADDLVVRTLPLRVMPTANAIAASDTLDGQHAAVSAAASIETLGATATGVCTDSGAACVNFARDSRSRSATGSCAQGTCFVPPGGCVQDLGTQCDPTQAGSCGAAQAFCQPILGSPGVGECMLQKGPCADDRECDPGDNCNNLGGQLLRLASPLTAPADSLRTTQRARTGAVFTGGGRCLQDLAVSCSDPCPHNSMCGPSGHCQRMFGACSSNADCPRRAECRPENLVVVTANDADGDEIPDAFDNCPTVPNPDQRDVDPADGIGDVCESGLQTQLCPSAPLPGCEAATSTSLSLHNDAHRHDRLTWEWTSANGWASGFGGPIQSSSYTMCVYDGAGLVTSATAPAGQSCAGGRPCWQQRAHGFRYRDESHQTGVARLLATGGDDGQNARILVEGRGTVLRLPDLHLVSPVVAQLSRTGGVCWQATYTAPFVTQTSHAFRARSTQ
ncbi:MAG TPA: hypothetical protein VGK30_13060 [Candidatus Binatia bacterium]